MDRLDIYAKLISLKPFFEKVELLNIVKTKKTETLIHAGCGVYIAKPREISGGAISNLQAWLYEPDQDSG